MADWNSPILTTHYATCLDDFKARDVDASSLAESPTNTHNGYIRYNRTENRFEEWDGSAWVPKVLSISGGGTGATDTAGIITALNLGTMAYQNSNAVNITGGNATLTNLTATTGQFSIIKAGTTVPGGTPIVAATGMDIYVPSGGLDQKYSRIRSYGGEFAIEPVNDAYNVAGTPGLVLNRSGNSFNNLEIDTGDTFLNAPLASNWIRWNPNGVGPPSLSSKSVGTKLILYPNFIAGTAADFAIGMEPGAMWHGVADGTNKFNWYFGGTRTASLKMSGTYPIFNVGDGQVWMPGSMVACHLYGGSPAAAIMQGGVPYSGNVVTFACNVVDGNRFNPAYPGSYIQMHNTGDAPTIYFGHIRMDGVARNPLIINYLNQCCVMDGSAASPSFTFQNVPNLGIFNVGNELGFVINGTHCWGLDASGSWVARYGLARLLSQPGSLAYPSISFLHANSGFSCVSAPHISVTVGGFHVMDFVQVGTGGKLQMIRSPGVIGGNFEVGADNYIGINEYYAVNAMGARLFLGRNTHNVGGPGVLQMSDRVGVLWYLWVATDGTFRISQTPPYTHVGDWHGSIIGP